MDTKTDPGLEVTEPELVKLTLLGLTARPGIIPSLAPTIPQRAARNVSVCTMMDSGMIIGAVDYCNLSAKHLLIGVKVMFLVS